MKTHTNTHPDAHPPVLIRRPGARWLLLTLVAAMTAAMLLRDDRAAAQPRQLWYDIRMIVTHTYNWSMTFETAWGDLHEADHRRTMWIGLSTAAVVLYRKDCGGRVCGDFSFSAFFDGQFQIHNASGRTIFVGPYCTMGYTESLNETTAPQVHLRGYVRSDSVRRSGIEFFVFNILRPSTVYYPPFLMTTRSLGCAPPDIEDPKEQWESTNVDCHHSQGPMCTFKLGYEDVKPRRLRFPAGDFGRRKFVLERTIRLGHTAPNWSSIHTLRYQFWFHRCPDQDLSDNCGFPEDAQPRRLQARHRFQPPSSPSAVLPPDRTRRGRAA